MEVICNVCVNEILDNSRENKFGYIIENLFIFPSDINYLISVWPSPPRYK